MPCNMEKYDPVKGLVKCGCSAHWKHPRWPTGQFCNDHKKTLETFFPENWEEIPVAELGEREFAELVALANEIVDEFGKN